MLPFFSHRKIEGTDYCYYLVISRNDSDSESCFSMLTCRFSIIINVFFAYSLTVSFKSKGRGVRGERSSAAVRMDACLGVEVIQEMGLLCFKRD